MTKKTNVILLFIYRVREKIKDGSIYLRNNVNVHTFCHRLQEVLPKDQCHYVFCNSGSEATQRALRLARATTGRDKIGFFQGGWHGINEWTMAEDGGRFGSNINSNNDGIPKAIKNYSLGERLHGMQEVGGSIPPSSILMQYAGSLPSSGTCCDDE